MKIVSPRCIACIALGLFLSGIGFENVAAAQDRLHETFIESIKGGVLDLGAGQYVKSSVAALDQLSIASHHGEVRLRTQLLYTNRSYDLTAVGTVYAVKGQGVYADKLLVGELQGNEKFSVAHFRLEKDSRIVAPVKKNDRLAGNTVLTLVLEDRATGDLIHLQDSVQADLFDALAVAANEHEYKYDWTPQEIARKTAHLMNIDNFRVHGQPVGPKFQANEITGIVESNNDVSASGSDLSVNATTIPVDPNEMKRLFEDLKDPYNNGIVDLDDYNIPESIFKGSGWKKYSRLSYHPEFFYHAYSADQGYYTLTQISFVDLIVNHDSDYGGHELQTEILHSMMVDYDEYSHELSVMYYGLGLTFKNYQLVMSKLEDRNVFTSRVINGEMATSPNYAKAAIALVPKFSTAYSIWDNLTSKQTQSLGLGSEKNFDSTYGEQDERYTGDVIRGINGDFSQYRFDEEGHYALLKGQISSPDGPYSLQFGYKYTAYHNM